MLGLQLFEDSGADLLIADLSHAAYGTVVENHEHGYGSLQTILRFNQDERYQFYELAPTKHLVLSDGGYNLFEGRIEDRRLVDGGIEIGAFGYWRSLYDAHYTALWSKTSYSQWLKMTTNDNSIRTPDKYNMDNNNRLYMSLKKNEVYANDEDICAWFFEIPHNGERDLSVFSFDYDVTLPTDWLFRIASFESGFGTGGWEATVVTGNGGNQTGSHSETITAGREIISLHIYNSAGSSYTNSGESDDWFGSATNIRVKSTSSANVYADEIIKDLISFINTLNSGQLSSATDLVEAPNVDLDNEIYEDKLPAEIAIDLAGRGDSSTPPDLYEVGVWENQQLHFRPRGSMSMDWYTDVVSLNLNSTIDTLFNNVYTVYKNQRDQTVRSAASSDSDSIAKYGLTRTGFKRSTTTSSTLANTIRDAHLERNKDITPTATIVLGGLFDKYGAPVPAYLARAGDTLTLRNLPPTAGEEIDKIRTMRMSRCRFDVDRNLLTPTPEIDAPGLQFIVAGNAAAMRG